MAELGWGKGVQGRAARVWAVALAVMFLAVGAVRWDKEALAFCVITLVAAAFTLVRKGLLGRIGLGLIALDTIVWMIPAMVSNIEESEQFADLAVPAVLSGLAIAVLALVIGLRPAPVLAVGGLLVIVGVVAAVLASSSGDPIVADVRVEMRNVAFSNEELTVPEGGTVAAKNRDLFWHTFTVSELDIDVRVPTGATRVIKVAGEPGEYEFVCAIPGHEAGGMKGTLTVSE